ncbi:MAG: DUF1846 domain-containing protein [Acidobacteria bacterium]|nr:DUF1846 domain-containing protein [Acidobacteriota bacterium]MBU1339050.1 DUF1846 domain-containing protein [Acidobacteriota bacterium]MBU1475720.1 DUF1846 domain-containing protein [Acidobacteriota bacterium]MBU2438087.1 DUF1846 domain-containing protein [Acidobacteriota bacterium]
MTKTIGFDNDLYLTDQSAFILERLEQSDNRLYLEFGGKLLFDYHAARVLPGYDPNVKMRLLQKLKDKAEIILCIYAGAIEKKKLRADFGITYDVDALKLIDDLRSWGLDILGVVITRFENQASAVHFKNKLERRGVLVVTHRTTPGYPTDVDLIVSKDGYGANAYLPATKPLIVVTGPGPGSGKLSTCLSQMYHDHLQGIQPGYAKFETFPIWNLPLKHPVNVAYEAATADIGDYNLIDPFHLEAYEKPSVNYNRDVEVFPVLKRILEKITRAESIYQSPTDMGVNCAGSGILDDSVVQEAARQEVIRRYFRYSCEYVMGYAEKDTVQRVELLMKNLGVSPTDRKVVDFARTAAEEAERRDKGNKGIFCGAAIELQDGTIIMGSNSPLMHASSGLVLKAIKHLAGIPDSIPLLSPLIIESIGTLKRDILQAKSLSLELDETMISLSIAASTNPTAQMALARLKELKGCEVHITHIPTPGDEAGLKRLGVNLTSEPNFSTKDLFTA